MSIEFVRADVLRNVHGRLLQKYGGIAGVRDEKALGAAVGRPENLAYYAGVESIGALGAAMSWSILRNHPFSDGNKRTAFASLAIFLDLNGYEMTCTEVEETAMVLQAAGSELSETEWTAWVERSIAPRRHPVGAQ